MARDNAVEISFKELGEWMKNNGSSTGAILFNHPPKRTPDTYEEKKRLRIESDGLHPLLDCLITLEKV